MIDPTLTITIDRAALSLSPLVFSGSLDGTALGVVEYAPPAEQVRVLYMPDSDHVHGSEPLGGSLQQSVLPFSWMRVGAAEESEIQAAFAEVGAAIRQAVEYTVTTQVSGAPAQAWRATFGSQQLDATRRSRFSMKALVPVYAVSIPVYPIPGA